MNRLAVSTDCPDITAISEQNGAEVIRRPAKLGGDYASSESALIHILELLEQRDAYHLDLVVFMQCTSPVRHPQDINHAVSLMLESSTDSLLSVVRSDLFFWRLTDSQPTSLNYDYRCRLRRQDREAEYVENGSIYVFKPWVLRTFNNRLG